MIGKLNKGINKKGVEHLVHNPIKWAMWFNSSSANYQNDKRIKANFQGLGGQADSVLQNISILMTISISRTPYDFLNGDKFGATIDLVNRRKGIKEIYFLVNDSIQLEGYSIRYPHLSEAELLEMTLEDGEKWVKDNSDYCKHLNIPYKIVRWSDLIKNQDCLFDYLQGVEMVEQKLKEEPNYQKSFDENIFQYLERLEKRNEKYDMENGYNKCLRYLINENGAFIGPWLKEFNCDYELYAPGRTPSMNATHHYFPEIFQNYMKILKVRFYHKQGLANQEQEPSILSKSSLFEQNQNTIKPEEIPEFENILSNTPGSRIR